MLVDCDMRKTNIHKVFKIGNKLGLSNVLSGMASIDDVIVKDKNGLNIVTSGPSPSNIAEILASKYMDDFIEICTRRFKYVIIDTAPLNIVNDASILSKYSGGVTFVVKSGRTRYKDVEKAGEILKLAGSKITGIVINGVEAKSGYYSRYKY